MIAERTLDAGQSDVARAAADLAARLPAALAPFAAIAMNYRWSWTPGGRGPRIGPLLASTGAPATRGS